MGARSPSAPPPAGPPCQAQGPPREADHSPVPPPSAREEAVQEDPPASAQKDCEEEPLPAQVQASSAPSCGQAVGHPPPPPSSSPRSSSSPQPPSGAPEPQAHSG